MDLFSQLESKRAPLADRMRPTTLDSFVGQQHIVGKGRLLRRAIETDSLQSSIFFGPPGVGKTTLASIIANTTNSLFATANAVTTGVKEVRDIIKEAEYQLKVYGKGTYLLLDECHRWSKSQSDSILPALEKGTIKFIGSTTENPLVSMTGALVSRCRLFEFLPLSSEEIKETLRRALNDTHNGYGNMDIAIDDEAIRHFTIVANGDARSALNALELSVLTTTPNTDGQIHITLEIAEESIQKKALHCDETQFYDMLSAFCKSLRGSDSDGALSWFARLLYAGVDPRMIARRLIAHASEDVGLANPNAMVQAVAAAQSVELVGLPEARLSLAQAIIYICESPKSNSVLTALTAAMKDAETDVDSPVPLHLRDTSYPLAGEKLGSGVAYKYPHDYPGHYIKQQYAPDSVLGKTYYMPSGQGNEAKIKANHAKRKK